MHFNLQTLVSSWVTPEQILFIYLIFPGVILGTPAKCHVTGFTAKKREIYKQFASLYAAPTIKLKEVKKITKSRPLPEGHTPDLHNMLIKVFQPQKDIHNLVSISE